MMFSVRLTGILMTQEYKKVKFGQLPGDYGVGYKIFLLEESKTSHAKSFRKDHKRRSKKRVRRLPIEQE